MKEEMRKNGLASPDRADALALSFAEPVMKRDVPLTQQAARRGPSLPVQGGYRHDPFS